MVFFLSAACLCACLDQRPQDSRTVADLCLPGWVQASCCFISPRVLWHLSLFTCSLMVIPSDRVSSLYSFSVFLSFLSSPPPSTLLLLFHCFWSFLHLHYNPIPSFFSPPNLAADTWILNLTTIGTAQNTLNLVCWGTIKEETHVSQRHLSRNSSRCRGEDMHDGIVSL